MAYVYIPTHAGLWTVGFFMPGGEWKPESDHTDPEDAAARVSYLNGGLQPLKCYRASLVAVEEVNEKT